MTIKSGTGTLCATGTTSHTGAMPIQPSGIIDENIQLPMLIAGNVAVCLSFGGSTTGGGYVFFAY